MVHNGKSMDDDILGYHDLLETSNWISLILVTVLYTVLSTMIGLHPTLAA